MTKEGVLLVVAAVFFVLAGINQSIKCEDEKLLEGKYMVTLGLWALGTVALALVGISWFAHAPSLFEGAR